MTAPADSALACRELVELVTDYLDGALPPAERTRLEAHVSACPACVAYVEQLRQLLRVARRLGRRLDDDALSPATRAPLLAAFRGYRSRRNGAGDP
jgi:anti-sigma factor RsiW